MPGQTSNIRFSAIVAASPKGLIGKDGDMPWRLSTDLQRFKKLTMGAPIVMGRKTFESIGRALPGRRNLVLSNNQTFNVSGVEVVTSLEHLLSAIDGSGKVFVIGGASIYKLLLPHCDEVLLTLVHTQQTGDTYIDLDLKGFRQILTERVPQCEKNSVPTEFQVWQRNLEI